MYAKQLSRAVIAGAGTMGASLAQIFAKAGIRTTLWNRSQAGLDRAAQLVRHNQAALVESGRSTEADARSLTERIAFSTDEACFQNAAFVLESIVEDLETKRAFFRRVCALVPADCLLTSNTSGLSITAIGEAVTLPERFCGMHWINPPHLVPLVEVIRGARSAQETADAVTALARRLGKRPIQAEDLPGFVMNRLQYAVLREALSLVETGAAAVEDVDAAVKYGLGLRYACIGPFETVDLGGVDVFCRISGYLMEDLADGKETPPLLQSLTDQGAWGVKSGRGFYDYAGDKAQAAIKERDRKFIQVLSALDLD